MKLFSVTKKHEGEAFIRNTIVSMGACIGGNGNPDGWYIKLELPFKKNKQYLDTHTFKDTSGPCRYAMVFRYRPKSAAKYFSIKTWIPINE
jgi:hypothetical protein